MDINFHFVRDRVASKSRQVSYCNSKDQIADVLTKPLVADKFHHFQSSLNVVQIPLDSRGHIRLTQFISQTHGEQDTSR